LSEGLALPPFSINHFHRALEPERVKKMENAVALNVKTYELELTLKYLFSGINAVLSQWTADWREYGDEIAGMSFEDYLEYKRIRKNAFWSAKFEALPNKDVDRLMAILRAVRRKHDMFLTEAERIRTTDAAAALRLENAA
jgi:hypothetical protein